MLTLKNNVCIDKNFQDQASIVKMSEIITAKCRFSETAEVTLQHIKDILEDQRRHMEMHEEFFNKTYADCKATSAENVKLATELDGAKEAKAQCEKQNSFIMGIYEKLNEKLNAICFVKTEELMKTVEMKRLEVQELLKQMQRKTAEINDK